MKYIMFANNEVVVFSEVINHYTIAQIIRGSLVSAGFVHLHDGELSAHGESVALNLKSRPEDTEIIKRQLSYY